MKTYYIINFSRRRGFWERMGIYSVIIVEEEVGSKFSYIFYLLSANIKKNVSRGFMLEMMRDIRPFTKETTDEKYILFNLIQKIQYNWLNVNRSIPFSIRQL